MLILQRKLVKGWETGERMWKATWSLSCVVNNSHLQRGKKASETGAAVMDRNSQNPEKTTLWERSF